MKRQAKRANLAQVQQHIQRQRDLGEKMIGGHDRVRPIELIATGWAVAMVILVAFYDFPSAFLLWVTS